MPSSCVNSSVSILKTLAALGAGMDVVSGGEYARARAAGVPGERIVFEPYSQAIFDQTRVWISEHDIIEDNDLGAQSFDDAVVSLRSPVSVTQ